MVLDDVNHPGPFEIVLQFWRMEFIQVPETPAPEPQEPDVPDCCGEEKIGESDQITLIEKQSSPGRLLYF